METNVSAIQNLDTPLSTAVISRCVDQLLTYAITCATLHNKLTWSGLAVAEAALWPQNHHF